MLTFGQHDNDLDTKGMTTWILDYVTDTSKLD